ncbi:MAG: hypothetical protein GW939_01580 [Candidatus Magasanikbacteria bacterium]|uniref:Glycerophosphoryl diester phosphodiesterase membrane domain-containing protein n=1 Tax=Candidatus Magasanikbacteria bacterium CG10_big_fil_rev_8_21_14_0_10_38_6 TaxID=1974647 RepID=A0A2M6P151_9BACT|nr:hypothetical protein [Candidatus Magasanikbacteria bacterium]NCS71998.1 hypothetical protein [Candidatus Magasanikbacteria bacterium]PIR77140.1 MAG: hypothetical protein COU30_04080 [Candidatus Magasanikbacteria bacterium CG10_big_fil_rev_8_21_14_0_10_38_6]
MKNSQLYRSSLHFSWRLIWDHKLLWVFGLFAAFFGQMGLVDLVGKITSVSTRYVAFGPLDVALSFFSLPSFIHFSFDQWAVYIWLFVLLLAIGIGLLFVSIVSQGALVHSVSQADKQKRKKRPIDIDHAWHAGITHFWRLLSLNIIKKASLFILSVVVGFSAANAILSGGTFDAVVFVCLFLLAIMLGFILSSMLVYAAGYVVIEEYRFKQAIQAAWHLFLDHWLVSLEVGVIILLANIGILFCMLFGFGIVFLHGAIVWILSILVHSVAIVNAVLFIEFLVFIAFIMFLGATFTVFSTSVWTYLFMHMHKHGITSRLIHLFHK